MAAALATGAAISARASAPTTRPAGSTSLLSTDETKDVASVVESVVRAGFPDATGAKVYRGVLHVSATFDATRQQSPLPTDESSMQESVANSTAAKYGFEFDGLHFKLPDGSWILACKLHFMPGKDDHVNTDNATEVALATLTGDAAAEVPFDALTAAARYLGSFPAKDRDRAAASLNRFVPVSKYLHMNADDFAPALALLSRAGWTDAADMSTAIADTRARSYWQMKPWSPPESVFDPTGKYPTTKSDQTAWNNSHTEFISEPPATALRRALFRWCRAQLMQPNPENAMFPPKVAAACCTVCIDPKDPQGNLARINAILVGTQIPLTWNDNASLSDRLSSWEEQPRMPRMIVNSGNGGTSFSTGFSAPKPAYEPAKTDLDALVALLADDRPSRFFDFTGGRAIGDNAWRAVTQLLNADPRTLAKYPTDKPWTTEERHAAAKAVQAWWKGHRDQYVNH